MAEYTPAMQQYVDTKKLHQDAILLFRIGDFYETFFEDAHTAHKELDLILTSKNKNSENPIPMAGIPHHSADKYIQKLVEKGYKVAIAEQTTDPQPGKIVEREVVSIFTPGTYIQENNKNFNFVLSIVAKNYKNGENYHTARGDFSIGEYHTKSFSDLQELENFIIQINPSEVIFDIDFDERNLLKEKIQKHRNIIFSIYDIPVDPSKFITNECNIQTLSSFGKALEQGRIHACGLLFNYLKHTQKSKLNNINKIGFHSQDNKVLLDNITIKNLEIFKSSYENQEKYSLIGILDNCKTNGGSRLLRYYLINPTQNLEELKRRLDQISYYQENLNACKTTNQTLGNLIDIPKICSGIIYNKLLASKFIRLRSTTNIFFGSKANSELISELNRLGLSQNSAKKIQDLNQYFNELLKEDEEINDDINFINDGYDAEIDQLRQTAFHSDKLLLQYQQDLVEASGVSNVKIKFIKNQGYFIEITNKDIEQFEKKLQNAEKSSGISNNPPESQLNIIRRNTLKGAQRYTSPYLDTLEQKIFSAKEKLSYLELQLLEEAKQKIIENSLALSEFSQKISELDLFTSHAILAKQNNFCKPQISINSEIKIEGGRHPVIEKYLPIDEQFIPNNLKIGNKSFLQIITGPNMGGKSTFLRQNAIIVLMAHCGLFVPAQKAEISIVDGIFARVGSGDVIAQNQSTFMTEMIEVANILNNATKQSFIIFDELGRGTSTYDGLALTKAILEYIEKNLKCKTLIATHYHELIKLEKEFDGIQNFSVQVYETDKEVVFMKKITEGGADKSYGIHVAKLAGINSEIIQKAEQNLQNLEQINSKPHFSKTLISSDPKTNNNTNPKYDKVKTLVQSFDINNMTPLQALQLLAKIKDELK